MPDAEAPMMPIFKRSPFMPYIFFPLWGKG